MTAFTVAHSITLALAATGSVSLSTAFIEPAIAVTIMLAALDNLWPIFHDKRVYFTFIFGLIHGFGFAGVQSELNLRTVDFAWALLQFNLGIELGQLVIVSLVIAVLFILRNRPAYPAVTCAVDLYWPWAWPACGWWSVSPMCLCCRYEFVGAQSKSYAFA